MRANLSRDEARRIALAAQGFAEPRPRGRVDARHLRRVARQVAAVQLDSVNVVVRAQYMTFFSRLGPYRREALDDLAYRRRELFEYWAHAACLLPVEHEPLFRHRMAQWGQRERWQAWAREHAAYLERVLEEVRERGPLAGSGLAEPGERSGPWWGWARGKRALEWHFGRGALTVADRRNFERHYDLRERVLPEHVLATPTPAPEDAQRSLVLLAARARGIGTANDLADYFRLNVPAARRQIAQLVADGALEQVTVEGWGEPAYLHPDATLPRRIEAAALLSPFDSLVWADAVPGSPRERVERVFDFRYRLELYVREPERVHGYYVMPFLLGDRLSARVDLKAERARGALVVRAAYAEEGCNLPRVASALAEELGCVAEWLELERVEVVPRGDLAPALLRVPGVHRGLV